jgi:hypothetical protein
MMKSLIATTVISGEQRRNAHQQPTTSSISGALGQAQDGAGPRRTERGVSLLLIPPGLAAGSEHQNRKPLAEMKWLRLALAIEILRKMKPLSPQI